MRLVPVVTEPGEVKALGGRLSPVVASRRGPVVEFSPARSCAGGRAPPGLGVARPVEGSCLAPGRVRVTHEGGALQVTDTHTRNVPHLKTKLSHGLC